MKIFNSSVITIVLLYLKMKCLTFFCYNVYRTAVDCLIAIGHILSFVFSLPESQTEGQVIGCAILGTFNEFALVSSNLWYAVLALDLIKAIRNPFR